MITCIEGRPGSGKSYHMAELIYDSLKRGRKVLTNAKSVDAYRMALDIRRRGGRKMVETLELFRTCNIRDLVDMPWDTVRETDIYLDEVMVVWLSREWKKFPVNLIKFLSQHRKLKSNLWYVTQSADLVDSTLRELTGRTIKVRNLSHFKIPFVRFLRLPEWFFLLYTGETKKMKEGFEIVVPQKRFFRYFDSYALVMDDVEESEVVDMEHAKRARKR